MMDKGLGFIRNVNLAWLDLAAESRMRSGDIQMMRKELDQSLKVEIKGLEARRKTIDVLLGVWNKSELVNPKLFSQAVDLFPRLPARERIWIHYGLTLLAYPFFRQSAAVLGQFARTGEPITRLAVKNRLASALGHLGSLNRAAERVVASLVEWGCLEHSKKEKVYIPKMQLFTTKNTELQIWLLICALFAHKSDQLPFPDLIRLPELFPFKISVTLDDVRRTDQLIVSKQGMWDMVEAG